MRAVVIALLLAATVAAQKRSPFVTSQSRCSKKCSSLEVCEIQQCEVCVPRKLTCDDIKCGRQEKCKETPDGPVCIPPTCADIKCAAGEICNDTPDGPDCVPDVVSCEGISCPRGTNCYTRKASGEAFTQPVCLPNTCEVRVCLFGLTCVDTTNGALCRRGDRTKPCGEGKYCPKNSVCENIPSGSHCVIN